MGWNVHLRAAPVGEKIRPSSFAPPRLSPASHQGNFCGPLRTGARRRSVRAIRRRGKRVRPATDPRDGAVPAVGFYLGELLGLLALAHGLAWWLWRHERAVPVALAVAAALFAYAHFAGTPYQAAKSIVVAAPLAMLIAGQPPDDGSRFNRRRRYSA